MAYKLCVILLSRFPIMSYTLRILVISKFTFYEAQVYSCYTEKHDVKPYSANTSRVHCSV